MYHDCEGWPIHAYAYHHTHASHHFRSILMCVNQEQGEQHDDRNREDHNYEHENLLDLAKHES